MHSLTQLVEIPGGSRHADDGHIEVSTLHHRLKCGEDLFVS